MILSENLPFSLFFCIILKQKALLEQSRFTVVFHSTNMTTTLPPPPPGLVSRAFEDLRRFARRGFVPRNGFHYLPAQVSPVKSLIQPLLIEDEQEDALPVQREQVQSLTARVISVDNCPALAELANDASLFEEDNLPLHHH